jgi:hypothetical protein
MAASCLENLLLADMQEGIGEASFLFLCPHDSKHAQYLE